MLYMKIKKIRNNFIFTNNFKRNICDIKNSQLEHDLHTSLKDRLVSPFSDCFIFAKLCIRNDADAKYRENKSATKISQFTVHLHSSSYDKKAMNGAGVD